ncbi:MAG: hypothetical protein MJ252_05000, partial [archaeon]|nr:hypothetical protein [archaeon]
MNTTLKRRPKRTLPQKTAAFLGTKDNITIKFSNGNKIDIPVCNAFYKMVELIPEDFIYYQNYITFKYLSTNNYLTYSFSYGRPRKENLFDKTIQRNYQNSKFGKTIKKQSMSENKIKEKKKEEVKIKKEKTKEGRTKKDSKSKEENRSSKKTKEENKTEKVLKDIPKTRKINLTENKEETKKEKEDIIKENKSENKKDKEEDKSGTNKKDTERKEKEIQKSGDIQKEDEIKNLRTIKRTINESKEEDNKSKAKEGKDNKSKEKETKEILKREINIKENKTEPEEFTNMGDYLNSDEMKNTKTYYTPIPKVEKVKYEIKKENKPKETITEKRRIIDTEKNGKINHKKEDINAGNKEEEFKTMNNFLDSNNLSNPKTYYTPIPKVENINYQTEKEYLIKKKHNDKMNSKGKLKEEKKEEIKTREINSNPENIDKLRSFHRHLPQEEKTDIENKEEEKKKEKENSKTNSKEENNNPLDKKDEIIKESDKIPRKLFEEELKDNPDEKNPYYNNQINKEESVPYDLIPKRNIKSDIEKKQKEEIKEEEEKDQPLPKKESNKENKEEIPQSFGELLNFDDIKTNTELNAPMPMNEEFPFLMENKEELKEENPSKEDIIPKKEEGYHRDLISFDEPIEIVKDKNESKAGNITENNEDILQLFEEKFIKNKNEKEEESNKKEEAEKDKIKEEIKEEEFKNMNNFLDSDNLNNPKTNYTPIPKVEKINYENEEEFLNKKKENELPSKEDQTNNHQENKGVDLLLFDDLPNQNKEESPESKDKNILHEEKNGNEEKEIIEIEKDETKEVKSKPNALRSGRKNKSERQNDLIDDDNEIKFNPEPNIDSEIKEEDLLFTVEAKKDIGNNEFEDNEKEIQNIIDTVSEKENIKENNIEEDIKKE